jgi:hypothetical protein
VTTKAGIATNRKLVGQAMMTRVAAAIALTPAANPSKPSSQFIALTTSTIHSTVSGPESQPNVR